MKPWRETAMKAYEEAEREFRVAYFLCAAVELGGNMGRAARRIGVHRNTMWRALNAAGYSSERVKRMARTQAAVRKRPQSARPAEIEVRRVA